MPHPKRDSLATLWEDWHKIAGKDLIYLPPNIAKDRAAFIPVIHMIDQTLYIIYRGRLPDGSFRRTQEDAGVPTMIHASVAQAYSGHFRPLRSFC
jgi:hypothetical protein